MTQTSAQKQNTHSNAVSAPGKRFFDTGGPRTIGRGRKSRRSARWRSEDFVAGDECPKNATSLLGTRFFALHRVGSDDIGRWEGAGTPLVSATVPKISKNLEKT